MVGDKQEERHGRVIDALKRSQSFWMCEENPALDGAWHWKSVGHIIGNLTRHMVNGRWCHALANLLSDIRRTLRRVGAEWWLLKNTDYIYDNFMRHMVKGRRWGALATLLSDVR